MTDPTNTGIALYNSMAAVSKTEIDTPVTFAELTASAGEFLPDVTFQSSPYVVLDGKGKYTLVGVPFYVRSWRASADAVTGNEFTILYVVTEKNESFIITDGSTGIHAQLQAITDARVAAGHASPIDHLLVPNGLRVSEYGVTAEGKPAKDGEKIVSQAATFYLA